MFAGERQLLLRNILLVSLSFVGSGMVVLVKYLSALDECWDEGIESPSGNIPNVLLLHLC